MNNETSPLTLMVIVAIFAGLIGGVIALTFGGGSHVVIQQAAGASPVGSTFGSAKYAGITASLATATSSAIVNTDSNDRYVISTEAACTGVGTSKTAYTGTGLSALTLQIGTSSAATPFNSAAAVSGAGITLATSSVNFYLASSTIVTGTSSNAMTWAAGTTMYFVVNATNTAACTFGVRYIGS